MMHGQTQIKLSKHVIKCSLNMLLREVDKGRRGRVCKQLLDDLKGKVGRWKLKEEALGCTLWNTGFGKGCGPVVRLRLGDEQL